MTDPDLDLLPGFRASSGVGQGTRGSLLDIAEDSAQGTMECK